MEEIHGTTGGEEMSPISETVMVIHLVAFIIVGIAAVWRYG